VREDSSHGDGWRNRILRAVKNYSSKFSVPDTGSKALMLINSFFLSS
jgi:hypothetical protein